MKAEWLDRKEHRSVLVFFAGWGMDAEPFRRLATDRHDVVVYYDYRDLNEVPCSEAVGSYPDCTLLAWSFGCAAANTVAQTFRWKPSRSVAINGTLQPESDSAGIPARLLDSTAANLLTGGWEKFVARMCPDEASRRVFNAARPLRKLNEAITELQSLRQIAAPASSIFNSALIGEGDRIILPSHQRCCWERYAVPCTRLSCGHFPFHLWSSWEEIAGCAE